MFEAMLREDCDMTEFFERKVLAFIRANLELMI